MSSHAGGAGLSPAAVSACKVPWSLRRGGLALDVRLTPKGGRDAIDGIEQTAEGRSVLKIRVRAVPEAGAANAALIKLLAETCDIPARAISLESGATARLKRLSVKGDGEALAARLAALFGLVPPL